MLFGVASWILYIFKISKGDIKVKKFYEAIHDKLPDGIDDFTRIFLQVRDHEIVDCWGWDLWELQPDGRFYVIKTFEKLEQFFVIRSFMLLRLKSDIDIEKINLLHNRELFFFTQETSDIMKMLDDLEKDLSGWDFVLDEGSAKKGSLLKGLLEKARKKQEEVFLRKKREVSISNVAVKEFKESFIENYKESYSVKKLFKKLGFFVNKTSKDVSAEVGKMGISTVCDKAAFF